MRIGWVNGRMEEQKADAESVGFGWEIDALASAARNGSLLPSHTSPCRPERNASLIEPIAAQMRKL